MGSVNLWEDRTVLQVKISIKNTFMSIWKLLLFINTNPVWQFFEILWPLKNLMVFQVKVWFISIKPFISDKKVYCQKGWVAFKEQGPPIITEPPKLWNPWRPSRWDRLIPWKSIGYFRLGIHTWTLLNRDIYLKFSCKKLFFGNFFAVCDSNFFTNFFCHMKYISNAHLTHCYILWHIWSCW